MIALSCAVAVVGMLWGMACGARPRESRLRLLAILVAMACMWSIAISLALNLLNTSSAPASDHFGWVWLPLSYVCALAAGIVIEEIRQDRQRKRRSLASDQPTSEI